MTLRPSRAALSWAFDLLVIALIAAALIWPVFRIEYSTRWESIEATFIADARWLNAHWMHPPWQPLWYTGTRTDFIYPPALRYGTAMIARYPEISTARAYHIYIALFYCVGIAGVYLLVRTGSGSRVSAWVAALGAALVSPTFAVLPQFRHDAMFLEPQRLGVLLRWGEGPHITSLAWIPIALAFTWRAIERLRALDMVLGAVSLAMVVSNNFYGATALAILFPIATWALWVTSGSLRVWLRAAAVGVLGYGLTAFWLTPSYVRITLRNMRYVASQGNSWSIWVAIAAVLIFAGLSYGFAHRRRELAWPVFVFGAAWLTSVNVLGHFWIGFRVIGEPLRLLPELDLVLILLLCLIGRIAWTAPAANRTAVQAAVVIGLLLMFVPSKKYVRHAWEIYRGDPHPTERVEYQLQSWMADHMPDARAYTTGSVRFWYDAWNDLPQLGGGSEQGMLNPIAMPAGYEVNLGTDGELAKMWLQVLGVDAMILNGPESREMYHDQKHPEKYVGLLPVLHDNGAGDIIYRIPRRWPGIARVVDTAKLTALGPVPGNGTRESLGAYVDVLENGPDAPAATHWLSPRELDIQAPVGPGQSLFVQVAYDHPWRAWSGSTQLRVSRGPLDLIRIDAPPGTRHVRLQYGLPVSVLVGRIITLLTIAILAVLVWRRRTVYHVV